MIVRQATRNDAHQLFLLEQLYYQERLAMLPSDFQALDGTMDMETIKKRIDDGHRSYVMELEDKIMGYIVCRIIDVTLSDGKKYKEGRVSDLYVDPEAREKGIATQLYKKACEWFVKEGCQWESLSVFQNNPAKQLYEKWGFIPFSTEMRRRI